MKFSIGVSGPGQIRLLNAAITATIPVRMGVWCSQVNIADRLHVNAHSGVPHHQGISIHNIHASHCRQLWPNNHYTS